MLSLLLVALAAATPPPVAPYLWAEARDGKIVVDATSEAGLGVDALFETLGKKYKKGSDAIALDVAPDDMPASLKGRKQLTAASTDGTVNLDVQRAVLTLGASAVHLLLYTGSAAKSPLLVGHTAALSPKARLREVLGGSEKPPAALAARLYAAIEKQLAPSARKSIALNKVIDASSLRFAAGTFARNGRWLVWIDAPLAKEGAKNQEELEMSHLVYGAVLGADGQVVDTIEPAAVTQSWWHPLYLVDADGDGQDELVGEPYYYEGASVVFYRWQGGTREAFVMMADGA